MNNQGIVLYMQGEQVMIQDITVKAYEIAREQYARLGVDTDAVLEKLKEVPLSLHCWQGDDVGGFETDDAQLSGGGIQVTGNFPGKARNPDELRKDIEKVYSMIPGKHRLNLHAIYGEFGGVPVDRDAIEPKHFDGWIDWAKEHTAGMDFNGTFFSHPKADSGYTLSSKDPDIRNFWIEHAKRCRTIGAHIGEKLGSPSVTNVWIPDGSKDYPVDRMGYRRILKDSLDAVFSEDFDPRYLRDAVETKLFGIGSEAYVVGSHEFYMNYANTSGKILCLDLGHFHPTELIADKISSILLFHEELLLHVSRPMRWDSDHIVVLNDDIYALFLELVRSDALERVYIGLDFFDGSLNRLGAWVIGARASLKGLLFALLEPRDTLVAYEESHGYFARLAMLEQLKTMPYGAVWDYYCLTQDSVLESSVIQEVLSYEEKVLRRRI